MPTLSVGSMMHTNCSQTIFSICVPGLFYFFVVVTFHEQTNVGGVVDAEKDEQNGTATVCAAFEFSLHSFVCSALLCSALHSERTFLNYNRVSFLDVLNTTIYVVYAYLIFFPLSLAMQKIIHKFAQTVRSSIKCVTCISIHILSGDYRPLHPILPAGASFEQIHSNHEFAKLPKIERIRFGCVCLHRKCQMFTQNIFIFVCRQQQRRQQSNAIYIYTNNNEIKIIP